METMDCDKLYQIRDAILHAVGLPLDSRLATHYAFAIAGAQEVYYNFFFHSQPQVDWLNWYHTKCQGIMLKT